MGKTFIFDSEGLTITDSEEKLKSYFGEDLGKDIMKLAVQFAKIEELEKRVNLLETELEDIKKRLKKTRYCEYLILMKNISFSIHKERIANDKSIEFKLSNNRKKYY